jgi:hypothetical protein
MYKKIRKILSQNNQNNYRKKLIIKTSANHKNLKQNKKPKALL